MKRPALAAILCLAAMSPRAPAGDTVQYGPPPDWVRPMAIPSATGAATDAPARSLLKNYQLRVTPTSTEFYAESVVLIETPQGLQALGNITLPWKPDTDVLTVHRFRLLRGKEEIDILGKGQKFEVLRRENNLEYSALDGVLTAAIQPNGMEVGDILDVAFTLRREFRLVPLPEFSLAGFIEAPPAERIEFRAEWDKSLALKWRTPDIEGAKETRSGSAVEMHWTANGLGPIDQPNDAPVRLWHEPMIELTTYKSWNDISQRLAPLYAKATELAPDSPLRKEAATIAAASPDPQQRLEAALKLAQERVRYVFLGMADGGIRPANADDTWQRRFGDCKAKTALLIALLRELGIAAEPVAVNTRLGDRIPTQLPALGAFDHVLVRAHATGKTWWLDGAAQASWRLEDMVTPGYRWGLPLTAKGDALVAMLADAPALPQRVLDIEIDAKEGLHTDAPFKAVQSVRGAPAAAIHSQVAQMTPAVREQSLKKYWKSEFDFIEPKSVREEFDAATGIVKLVLEGTADMDWAKYRYVTDHMRTGATFDYKRETAVNKDAPFIVNHPFYSVVHERIALPAVGDFTVSGKDYDAELAGYRYVRRAKIDNRVFTSESSVMSLAHEVDAAKARSQAKTLNDMWADKLEIVAKNYDKTDADIAAMRTRKFDDRANLVWRGLALLDRGDYDAAFADFDAANKIEPGNASVLANRGITQFWREDFVAARADLEAALAKDPRSEVALRGLGAVDLVERKLPDAIAHLSRSLELDPDDTFALGKRALAYRMNGDDAKALADAAEAIRVLPTYIDMYSFRAQIFHVSGHDDDALRELEAMTRANPDGPYLQWTLGAANFMLGRFPEALAALDRYVAASPEAESYFARANYRDPADTKGRLADVDLALAKSPDEKRYLTTRAEILGEAGDHAGAVAAYTALLKKTTNTGTKRQLTMKRGVQSWQAGRQADARKDFAASIADDPDSETYNSYCWSLATAHIDLEAALAACDKALKVAPRDAPFLDSRGFALLQLGRFDDAIASYDAALAVSPQLGPSLYGRGVAKNRRCQCTDGAKDIDAANRIHPTIAYTFRKAGLAP